ncbi:uncharacterized protein V6R79_019465 [Siganus canaliculatus]
MFVHISSEQGARTLSYGSTAGGTPVSLWWLGKTDVVKHTNSEECSDASVHKSVLRTRQYQRNLPVWKENPGKRRFTPIATRNTTASRKAEENLPMDLHQDDPPPDVAATGERSKSRKKKAADHMYALPSCPKAVKAKLDAALKTVRKLQREKSNALARERRAKKNMHALLQELKDKNLINEELKDKLECYSDLPVHLLSRQGVEYTKAQRDFALTLHLPGPKAYFRETLKIHLPHPSSLQRWLSSLDAKPCLNKMMLDMLERRRQEDEAKYGCVTLMIHRHKPCVDL